jgi:hypothetical protein
MILDPDAFDKAFHDTAKDMTEELRQNALDGGWHADVVNNMSVKYSENDGFVVDIHPDYSDRAFMHEFGSPGKPPTAVIRKYRNKDTKSESSFFNYLERHGK